MNMATTTRQLGSVTIVDIKGRIVREESVLLRDLLSNLLATGHRKIVINLADTSQIDTAGLAYLVSCLVSVRKQQGELMLLNPAKMVREVIQMSKLDTVFHIFDDESAAVMSLQVKSAAVSA